MTTAVIGGKGQRFYLCEKCKSMDFKTQEFDKRMFFRETGFHASEHPHLYFEWLQIKLLEKLTRQLEALKPEQPMP